MSKESLEQLLKQVVGDEALQAKIGKEIDPEELVALAAENGFSITGEEIIESAELSDEELEDVAGGFRLNLTRHTLSKLGGGSRRAKGRWVHLFSNPNIGCPEGRAR